MGSQTEVNNMVSALVTGHYNAVIVQVLAYMDNSTASHGAHWKSTIVPWSSRVKSSFDPLAYLCTQAHANGIEVHAWLGGSGAAMYRVSTTWPPAGNTTLAAHPEWFIAPYTNSEGNAVATVDSLYALDMGSPDVQEYIVSIVKELVTNYPIDGINWDDELNNVGYNAGFGYPAYSQSNYPRSGLARYRINTGVTGTPVNTDSAWADYRRRFKNELMARVQAEIQSIKTNPRQPLRHTTAALAYSPVPSSCDFTTSAPYTYYCDWAGMLRNGFVDAVIPQTYSSSTFNTWADRIAACWQYNRHVYPGIGAYLTNNARIASAIGYTRSKGLKGNSIYSYAVPNSAASSDWWAYAAANVYTNVVTTPPMPWRNSATATEGIVWGRVQDFKTGLYLDDATVTVVGGPTVKTDGNGYFVATLVPTTAAGTARWTTASKTGMVSQSTNAIALAGDIVRYNFLLNAPSSGVPDAPSGLIATAVSSSQINLSWTDNATNETTYIVARGGISGGPYIDVASLSSNAVAYTNTGLSASTPYFYVVRATNSAGFSADSPEASATTPSGPATPPSISVPPAGRTIFAGESAHFSVVADGTPPLTYQWRLNGAILSDATKSTFTLSNVATDQAGDYSVVITNAAGAITSVVATLTVEPAMNVGGWKLLWSLAPYSRPYLTTNSLPYERGMAHNPVTRRLLVASRNGPHVYALDAGTGADQHELSVSGVSGGTYALLMIGVADDGVVYAGNLTTAGTTTAFKLYRWANDESVTVPVVAYSGDPGAGNSQRWGDTLDVRGAGASTQVILGSRAGNVVAVLTTTDGTNFTSRLIAVADAPTGAFGLGMGFGVGNTFWGKATSQNLRQVSFDLVAGTGTTIRSHGSSDVPASVAPLGVDTALGVLGGVNVAAAGAGNNFRLYNLAPAIPVLIVSTNFASDNENTASGTGAVDFDYDRAFALGANNGLVALQLLPAAVATAPIITAQPQDQTVNAGQSALFAVTATGTAPLAYQWRFNGLPIADATESRFTTNSVQAGSAGLYSAVVTNSAGSATSSNAVLTVNVPPTIDVPPQSLSVKWSSNATFTVHAAGTAPLSYQWHFRSADLAGATTSSFTRANAMDADAGEYSVTVTNVAGNTNSAPATLTILPPQPAHFESITRLPDGRVLLYWTGEPGWSYNLQSCTNVNFMDWSWLGLISSSNGWFGFVDDDATNNVQRFYRTTQ